MNDKVLMLKERLNAAPPIDDTAEQHDFTDAEIRLIEDEKAFERVFGKTLDLGKRDRRALIQLQRKYDLTQKRIRAFARNGNIVCNADAITVKGTGTTALIGLGILSFLVPLAGLVFLNFATLIENGGLLKTAALNIGAFGAVFGVTILFIRPWALVLQTLKQNNLHMTAKIEGPR